ncbi:RagB/SusD family nutrient uptake outer membrane protein [Dyadobacter chenhuakuii]|uniref:RagB/SusD family nutrient uptake outer membrane protein n=1 Tax=Dyadobacter chenhuakuii TaxID=2909339 RepID=A0ABY4XQS7_9BACT|nr:RagB/SusD family nutrient uptake outer membrane protein [Dyadobacter chenhuakuii]MCF2492916.1 RagB/SusD family nutrient uptake outer membrane protein [Dyadobacter chenhuakuii]USJ32794.1 RagB/SusD family nutrient uptake outer membrane protein [Dyadobacter chenhuakuii]
MRKFTSYFRYNIALLALTGLLASSCESYFLDAEPQQSISDGSVIIDAATAETALLGVYDKVQSSNYYGGDGYQAAAYLAGGDNIWVGTLNYYATFITHTYRSDNTLLNNVWSTIFTVVNGANNVIDKVEKLDSKTITDAQRKQISGEAYFLRSLAYFDLARAWGNVPVVLKPTTAPDDFDGVKQSTQEQVYRQVLEDLTKAEGLLGNTVDRNRVTQKTVSAFKARLHLYLGEYENAEEYATKLISDSNYELISWASFINSKNSRESIFELAYSTADRSAHYGAWSSDGYRNQFGPGPALFKLLQDPATGGDRKALIKDMSTPAILNYYVQLLYWRATNDNPTYLFRIAEQYLIRAEARAKKATPDLAGAVADLNAVKTRAKVPVFTSTNKAAIERAIEDERRAEFALEPHRWFDLVRTGRAGAVLGVGNADKWIFPIPFNDLAADKDLVQNKGY